MKKDKTSNPMLKTKVLRLQGNLSWNGELAQCWERVKVGLESLFPLEKKICPDWEYKEAKDIPFQIVDDTWKIVDKYLSTLPLTATTMRLQEDWRIFVKELLKVQTENARFTEQYSDILLLLEWLNRKKSGQLILDDCFEEVLGFGIKASVFTSTSLKATCIENTSCDVSLQIFRFMIRLLKDERGAGNATSSTNEMLTSYANSAMKLTLRSNCPSNLQASGALLWCLMAKRVLGPSLVLQKLLSEFFKVKFEDEAANGVLDLSTFQLDSEPAVELRVHFVAAILSLFPRDLLYGACNELKNTSVAFWALQQCLLYQQTSGRSNSVALHVARTVEAWSAQVASLFGKSDEEDLVKFIGDNRNKKAWQGILAYLWESLESDIDQIRHAARAILANMMKIYRQILPQDKYEVQRRKIFENILPASLHQSLGRGSILGLKAFVEVEGSNFVIAERPSLPEDLLRQATSDPASSKHVKDAFSALMLANLNEVTRDLWRERWIQLLLKYMKIDRQSDLKECLEAAVDRDPGIVEYVIGPLNKNEEQLGSALEIVIPVLYTCKKKGLLLEKEQNEETGSQWKGLLGWNVLRQALENRHDHVRLLAFGMIADGPKTTEKFGPKELKLCENFVRDNMAIPSVSFLQQFLGYLKKILFKIKNGGLPLKNKLDGTNLLIVNGYREFLKNLYEICWNALLPGTNVTRRGSALQILSVLKTVFSDTASRHLFFEDKYLCVTDSLPLLLNCFHVTYEGIQDMTLDLVKASHLSENENKYLVKYWYQSLQFASSAKPPEAATASCYIRWLVHTNDSSLLQEVQKHPTLADLPEKPDDLLYSVTYVMYSLLKDEWLVAKKSLLEAASVAPMYGLMLCIRLVLADKTNRKRMLGAQWRDLLVDLVDLSKSLYEVVAPIVNSSSPEGYLPVEFDGAQDRETNEDELPQKEALQQRTVSSQVLLVCCWRTVKEVSLFMGDVATFIRGEENELPNDQKTLMLPTNLIATIGQFFMSMLSEIVHRGAFEQAYAGFCKYCDALHRSKNSQLIQLSRDWIEELLLIASGKSAVSVTATRRSAGLPFMLQALLAPCAVDDKDVITFNRNIMKRLLNLANWAEDPIVTVHSLNILRALYRDSRFVEAVMPYVTDGVELAIRGFADSEWAVRNSSTLLFAALMTRIFGVKRDKDENSRKNRLCIRLFSLRYPELLPFLLKQLQSSVSYLVAGKDEQALQPALYPVLLILERLTPDVGDMQSRVQINEFICQLKDCCRSPVWKIRVGAATALTSIVRPDLLGHLLNNLLQNLLDFKNHQNALHGTLLQIKAVLQLYESVHERIQQEIKDVLAKHTSVLWGGDLKRDAFPPVRAVILEIFTIVAKVMYYKFNINDDPCPLRCNRLVVLYTAMGKNGLPGDPVSSSKAVEAWYTMQRPFHVLDDEPFVPMLMRHPIYEVRLASLVDLSERQSNLKSKLVAEAIRGMVCEETHPEVLALLLGVYSNVMQSPRQKFEETREFVPTLLAMLRCNSNANLRSAVVGATTSIISQLYSQATELAFSWAKEMFVLSTGDCEAVEVRLAVAHALSNFSGLRNTSDYGHHTTCLLFLTLFNLLLDPEFAVREAALEIVAALVGHTNLNHVTSFRIAVRLFLDLAAKAQGNVGVYLLSLISTVLSADSEEDGEELSLVFSKGEENSYREPRLVADVVLQQVLAANMSLTTTSCGSLNVVDTIRGKGSKVLQPSVSVDFGQILFQNCSIQTLRDLVQSKSNIQMVDIVRCLRTHLDELSNAVSQIDYEKTQSVEAYCCSQILAMIKPMCPVSD